MTVFAPLRWLGLTPSYMRVVSSFEFLVPRVVSEQYTNFAQCLLHRVFALTPESCVKR